MDKPSHSKPGPLAGVRILDLTGVVFGPLATQILGDMGAESFQKEEIERWKRIARIAGIQAV